MMAIISSVIIIIITIIITKIIKTIRAKVTITEDVKIVNKKNELGLTELHFAVLENDVTKVKLFLSAGADANEKIESTAWTPLHLAAVMNKGSSHFEVIEALLKNGAQINAQNNYGETPIHYLIKQANVRMIQLFLNFKADVNLKDSHGETSLFTVVRGDDFEVARLLVNQESADIENITAIDGSNLLHNACAGSINFNIIKMLLEKGVGVNAQDENGRTPLHYLAKNGNIKTYQLILNYKPRINVKNNVGETALFEAVRNNNVGIVKLLVDYGYDVNVKNHVGETALFEALRINNTAIVQLLVDYGHDVNCTNLRDTQTPLHVAANKSDNDCCFRIVQLLLENKAAIEAVDKYGNTPLHYLVRGTCNFRTIELILNFKAEVNVKNDEGQTPIFEAVRNKNIEIIKLLVQHGSDINSVNPMDGSTLLHVAAAKSENDSYFEIIKLLLESKVDVNSKNKSREMPLHCLFKKSGNVKTVKLLLNFNADVNAKDCANITPLFEAVRCKNIELVELLLSNGSDVNSIGSYSKQTPLQYAACMSRNDNCYEIIKVLLKYKADIDAQDTLGSAPPLHYVVRQNNPKTVELLLDHKPNVNLRDNQAKIDRFEKISKNSEIRQALVIMGLNLDIHITIPKYGSTPLHEACKWKRNFRTIELLLKNNADINAQNKEGKTPLHILMMCQSDRKIVRLLLDYNADVTLKDDTGEVPLIQAVRNNNAEIIQLLLDHGSDINGILSKDGLAPLHVAACASKGDSYFKVIEMLLENGADIDAQDNDGQTSLHQLVKKFNLKTMKLLLELKADVTKINNCGETPLITATNYKNFKVAQLLVHHGSDVNFINPKDGQSPLHKACIRENFPVVEVLLEKAAQVNGQDLKGRTALHYSVRRGNVKLIELLLKHKADVNIADNESEIPLIKAVRYRSSFEILQLLVDHGSDFNKVNQNESSPLHEACMKNNNFSVIEFLLKSKSNVDAKNQWGRTPLHYLSRRSNVKTVELLLSYNADVDTKDNLGETPLFKAIRACNFKVALKLIDHGSDVNISNSKYEIAPLHEACKYECDKIVMKYLIKKGANIEALDNMGRNPLLYTLHFSNFRKDEKKIKFLLKYSDANAVDSLGRNILHFDQLQGIWRIVLEHVAKIQTLELPLSFEIVESISNDEEYKNYYQQCTEELLRAMSSKFENSWVSFFNLLVGSKRQLKNFAGNEDLVKNFNNTDCASKFPIFGKNMQRNMEKGIKRRKLYDEASIILGDCLPIYGFFHLIVRDILDSETTDNLSKLCE